MAELGSSSCLSTDWNEREYLPLLSLLGLGFRFNNVSIALALVAVSIAYDCYVCNLIIINWSIRRPNLQNG